MWYSYCLILSVYIYIYICLNSDIYQYIYIIEVIISLYIYIDYFRTGLSPPPIRVNRHTLLFVSKLPNSAPPPIYQRKRNKSFQMFPPHDPSANSLKQIAERNPSACGSELSNLRDEMLFMVHSWLPFCWNIKLVQNQTLRRPKIKPWHQCIYIYLFIQSGQIIYVWKLHGSCPAS